MSHTKKRISLDPHSFLSACTQKLRIPLSNKAFNESNTKLIFDTEKNNFKRICCDEEKQNTHNHHQSKKKSKELSSIKMKNSLQNSDCKNRKKNRKKYLQEELDKIIQKKHQSDQFEEKDRQILQLKSNLAELKQEISELLQKQREKAKDEAQIQHLKELIKQAQHNQKHHQQHRIKSQILKAQLQNEKQLKKNIQEALVELKRRCADQQQQIKQFEKVTKENINYKSQREELMRQLQSKNEIIDQLNSQIDSFEEQSNSFEQIIQSFKRQNLKQQQEKLKLNNKIFELERDRERLEMDVERIRRQLSSNAIGFGVGKSKLGLSSMQSKCQQLYEEIKMEKAKWDQILNQSQAEKVKYQMQIEKYKIENEQIQGQINLFKQLNNHQQKKYEKSIAKMRKDFEDAIQQKQKLICDFKSRLDECTRDLTENVKKRQNLTKQVSELVEQKSRLLQQINDKDNKLNSHSSQYLLLKEQNDKLQKEIDQLNGKLSIEIEKADALQGQKASLTNKWRQKQKGYQNEKQQLEKEIKGTLQAHKRKCDDLEAKYNYTQQEVDRISQIKELLQHKFKLAEAQIKLLEDEIKVKQVKQREMFAIVGQLQIDKKGFQGQIMRYQTEIETNIKQIRQLKNQIQILTNENKVSNEKQLNLQNQLFSSKQSFFHQRQALTNSFKQEIDELHSKLQLKDESISSLQNAIKNVEQTIEAIKMKLAESEAERSRISNQLFQLTTSSKRNESISGEEKRMLQTEIQIKNKNIAELKSIIKIVREESLNIKEEVEEYRYQLDENQRQKELVQLENDQMKKNIQHICQMTQRQISYFKDRIEYLAQEKQLIQIKVSHLHKALSQQSYFMEQMKNQFERQSKEKDDLIRQRCEVQRSIEQHKLQAISKLRSQQQKCIDLREQHLKQMEINQMQIHKLKAECRLLANSVNCKDKQTQRIIEEYEKIINEKQNLIKQLKSELQKNDERRIRIKNEVHMIQNQISSLANKSSLAQQQHMQLNKRIEMLNEQIISLKNENKQINQKHQNELNQIYQICDQRKTQIANMLKDKIKELAKQLTLSIEKIQAKNSQINNLSQQVHSLKDVLEQNHIILQQERCERQKLEIAFVQLQQQAQRKNSCFTKKQQDWSIYEQNYKMSLERIKNLECCLYKKEQERKNCERSEHSLKEKVNMMATQLSKKQEELVSAKNECEMMNQKINKIEAEMIVQRQRHLTGDSRIRDISKEIDMMRREISRKDQLLAKSEQDRISLLRQIENQSMSIKVLREENRNIQKVMSEQLEQRRSIIEQLMNEKKILYSQINKQ